ncbi:hypothetical protein BDV25DRAFT_140749 [Aspergillus avenaceus]|uniref:Zn(2)-C6 fungal-type domain-containing protein n=1 Tax=Aspergillus avenaceus TaxID=36643 RepID=A0A5N6TT11_ASPAV|nr:hypothetical protein BDV25DRAFT_140749 [Aspergillus avenaceus]
MKRQQQDSSTTAQEEHGLDNRLRKRVCKACDRCRLKKCKCDGDSPCSRCREHGLTCHYGERRRVHDKVYPRGYVEMLEQQQQWLVDSLRKLYQRVNEGQEWSGAHLQFQSNGYPLIHDLVSHLGALERRTHDEPEKEAVTNQITDASNVTSTQQDRLHPTPSSPDSIVKPSSEPPASKQWSQQAESLDFSFQLPETSFDFFMQSEFTLEDESLDPWQPLPQWPENFDCFHGIDYTLGDECMNPPFDDLSLIQSF